MIAWARYRATGSVLTPEKRWETVDRLLADLRDEADRKRRDEA